MADEMIILDDPEQDFTPEEEELFKATVKFWYENLLKSEWGKDAS